MDVMSPPRDGPFRLPSLRAHTFRSSPFFKRDARLGLRIPIDSQDRGKALNVPPVEVAISSRGPEVRAP
ncbi:MAG: hypothetical protein QOH09_2185 [Pseudonocardiales bacterium]|jgi:hypothetical protein|nr:hypothetical protein [Pseudonocardiales bacterium]